MIKTRQPYLGSLELNLGLLNEYTACLPWASQVSVQPGAQFRSGVLKGMINLLLKPDKRLSCYVQTAKEKLTTMYAEQLNKFKQK